MNLESDARLILVGEWGEFANELNEAGVKAVCLTDQATFPQSIDALEDPKLFIVPPLFGDIDAIEVVSHIRGRHPAAKVWLSAIYSGNQPDSRFFYSACCDRLVPNPPPLEEILSTLG